MTTEFPHFNFFRNTFHSDLKNLSACETATLFANITMIGKINKGRRNKSPYLASMSHAQTSAMIYAI